MTEVLERNQLRLSGKRVHGRVVNVVADLLRKKLHIPNVYLYPRISGVPPIDVLAVDRAGSGDLYSVEIKIFPAPPGRALLRSLFQAAKVQPFHFKYLALPLPVTNVVRFAESTDLFDETGIGRIGILSFDSSVFESSCLEAKDAVLEILRPERFRVQAERLSAIDKFLSKAKPDIEVRI